MISPIRAQSSPTERSRPTRVAAFERYAELLVMQLDALERDDLAGFAELADQRTLLADEIDEIEAATQAEIAAETEATIDDELADVLRRCREYAAAVDTRLRHMRDETLRESMELEHARHAARAYAGGSSASGSLDIDL